MNARVSSRERPGYWISLALLLVVVPLAVVVNSDGEFISWLERRMEHPIAVARGESGQSGGGRWRIANLRRLPGTLPDTNLILAEVDLSVQDATVLQQGLPCSVTLTDGSDRRWAPLFSPGTYLRDSAPEAADLPQCSVLTASADRTSVRVVELYLVPKDADGFTLSLSLTGAPSLLLK